MTREQIKTIKLAWNDNEKQKNRNYFQIFLISPRFGLGGGSVLLLISVRPLLPCSLTPVTFKVPLKCFHFHRRNYGLHSKLSFFFFIPFSLGMRIFSCWTQGRHKLWMWAGLSSISLWPATIGWLTHRTIWVYSSAQRPGMVSPDLNVYNGLA